MPSDTRLPVTEAARLASLVHDKDLAQLKEIGGVEGVVNDIIGEVGEEESRRKFGANRLPQKGGKSLWRLLWEAYQDFTLKLLTIAAIVSLAIGIYGDVRHGTAVEWIEGAAILLAVMLVVAVNAANDWQKERQFRSLNAQNADRQITVIKAGVPVQVSVFDLVVGQVLSLEAGVRSFGLILRMCCQPMVSCLILRGRCGWTSLR